MPMNTIEMNSNNKVYLDISIKYYIMLFSFLFISITSFSNNRIQKISKIDSLIAKTQQIDNNLTANNYAEIGLHYLYSNSYKLALKYAMQAERYSKIENNDSLAMLYIVKGQVYLNFGAYVKSMDNFSTGEQIAIKYNNSNILINAKYGKGLVYEELREYKQSLIELYKGLEVAKEKGSLKDKAIFYNAIGKTLQDSGNLESSIKYLNKFYQVSILRNDTLNMIYALINIGESLRKQKKYSDALKNYKDAEQLNVTLNNAQAKAAIYGNIALIHSALGNSTQSIIFFNKCIKVSHENAGLTSYILQDLKNIAKEYYKENDYYQAYSSFNKFIIYSDSISEVDYMEQVNRLNYSYQFEEYEINEKIVEQKLFTRTIFIYFFSIFGILTLLFSYILLSRYKLKNIKLKNEVNNLNKTLDKKNRELVSSLIEQSLKTEALNEVKNLLDLLEYESSTQTLKNRLIELTSKLSEIEKSSYIWESFKFHFEQVHPDFFIKLQNISTELTISDLRFCAYIKLNISSKEISKILNINIRSTQATRLRIKKKLNIPKSKDLISVLQSY